MRSGRLRHRASIYVRSTTPDSYGALDSTYTLLRQVPASIVSKRPSERFGGAGDLSKVWYEIRVRFTDDLAAISPSAEIEITDKRLSVLGISDPTGMRRELIITAEDRE